MPKSFKSNDSDINLQIACELLEKVPLVLDTASDGEEGLQKAMEEEPARGRPEPESRRHDGAQRREA